MMIGFPGVPSGGDVGGGVGDLTFVAWCRIVQSRRL